MNVLTCGKPGYLGQIIADKVLSMYEADKLLRLCFQYNFMDKKSFASPHCSVLNAQLRQITITNLLFCSLQLVKTLSTFGHRYFDWRPLLEIRMQNTHMHRC